MAQTIILLFLQCIMVTSALNIVALSTNCSVGTTSCGPSTMCCPSGYTCTARRGIPICVNVQAPTPLVGYDHHACLDPYFFPCDILLDIPGFCCPIGTMCAADVGDRGTVQCIDAYGSTRNAIPSSTMISAPVQTPDPVPDNDSVFSPPSAWNISDNQNGCGISKFIHTTNTLNASITFNYTGPSVVVHTITSQFGGVFSVFVDGFDTQTTVDTNANYNHQFPGEPPSPKCLPLQFPPFVVSPPSFASNLPSGHSITLQYVGASPEAPNGSDAFASVQFEAFSVPTTVVDVDQISSGRITYEAKYYMVFYITLGYFVYSMY